MRRRLFNALTLLALVLCVAAGTLALVVSTAPRYADVDLKSMGNFPLDPFRASDAQIPARWRALDRRRVVLLCEVFLGSDPSPYDEVTEAQLIYSLPGRWGPPKVQERVFAQGLRGVFASGYRGPARVYGTLHVGAERETPGGPIASVYRMTVDRVEPADASTTDYGAMVRAGAWGDTGLTVLALGLVGRRLYLGASERFERRLTGRCVKCGYDLRATPDRCPECGAAVVEGQR